MTTPKKPEYGYERTLTLKLSAEDLLAAAAAATKAGLSLSAFARLALQAAVEHGLYLHGDKGSS